MYKYGAVAYGAYCSDAEEAKKQLREVPDIDKLRDRQKRLLEEGAVWLVHYPHTDTEVVLVKIADPDVDGRHELVLGFRGTSSNQDWITDIQMHLIPITGMKGLEERHDLDGCKVHAGFLRAFNNTLGRRSLMSVLWSAVGAVINALPVVGGKVQAKAVDSRPLGKVIAALFPRESAPPTRVVTCGHSLGGALATLAAVWAKAVVFPDTNVACYAFASPRVGSSGFASKFNELLSGEPVYRFTYKDDPVPMLPPQGMGYEHVESSVFLIEPDKSSYGLTLPPTDGKTYAALLSTRPMGGSIWSRDDHLMRHYLVAIAAAIGVETPLFPFSAFALRMPTKEATSSLATAEAAASFLAGNL